MDRVWNARLQVDLDAIKNNIEKIKEFVGNNVDIMPIIKDNAYGTQLNTQIDFLHELGVNIVGVAIVDEGIYLRRLGYKGEIFVLNQPMKNEIQTIIDNDLIIGVGSIDFLSELGKYSDKIKIHIEIGTGMGRTGIQPLRINEYIDEAMKYDNITLDGIYTHFACSESDREYTLKQIESFNSALDVIKKKNINLRYIHACNSAGIVNFPEAHFNLIRPGIILYGYLPDDELKNIGLKPSLKLKSQISFLKTVKCGTGISYGRSFVTQRESKIATIPLGYADGIRRTLSNKGSVIIKGQIAPIVGKVCMDCFMVDVTDIEGLSVGDDVFIWDNETITLEEIADICDTINYEVMVSISSRVRREFIGGKQ